MAAVRFLLLLLCLSIPGNSNYSTFYWLGHASRLAGERYSRLKTNGFDGIDHAAGPAAPLSLTYGLDELNRRVGAGSAPGISVWTDTDKDGVADAGEVSVQTHAVDERGALTGLDDGSAVEPVGRDESGAVTELHGREIYRDWLGRPVLALNAAGDAVFAVRYDGFGRVAQRRAPWPTDATKQRIESYFYDGVRRIQEVFTDPVGAVPPWPQPHGGGGGGSTPETRTEAEYVWSAASGQPFDTAHVQIDWWDREAWFIQDHQTGTVRAYTDPSGEVAEQYGFDAFGNLIRRDEFTLVKGGSQGYYRSFRQRLGHHGLFAERVDGHTNQRVLTAGAGGEVWYQSRSRWYAPELGRFLSSDPNAMGIPVVSGLASLGQVAAGAPSGSFGWEAHYGDGWDTYTAYGANPVRAQDPTGLFFGGLLDTLGATATSMHMRATQNGVYAKMFWGGTINGAWGGFWGGINAGMNDQSVTAGFFSGALTRFANGALTVGVAGMGAQGVKLLAAVFSVGGVTAAVDAAVMGESPRDVAKAGLIGGIGNSVGVGLGKADSSALLDPRNQDAVESAIDILWPALEGWAKTLVDTWGFW